MKVTYADEKLEILCTDESVMKRKRGDIAPKLRLRVSAMEAAGSLGELKALDPLGKWHQLTGDRNGTWAGSLSRNHRIIIEPGDPSEPESSVSVCVIELVDYH